MTGLRWYAHELEDYEKKTRDLTMIQHGAYRLLLDHYYTSGAPLPANDKQLFRICRALEQHEQDAVLFVVERYFVKEGDGYHNHRADEELQKAKKISDERAKAAKKSHANRPAIAQANEQQLPLQSTIEQSTELQDTSSLRSEEARSANTDEIAAIQAYNEVAKEFHWPKAQVLTPKRKSGLRRRLDECGGIQGWLAAMAKARASPFLRGETGRDAEHEKWVPDLDFFLQQSSFTKLMEGKYDDRTKPQGTSGIGAVAAGIAASINAQRAA